jgi:succinyl-diaminopimelate desuccinylase
MASFEQYDPAMYTDSPIQAGAATALLRDYMEIPTVTGNLEANHQGLSFIGQRLSDAGLYVSYIPRVVGKHDEALLASSLSDNTMNPRILLSGHQDVTPVIETTGHSLDYDYHPEENIPIWVGRGAVDMKAAVAGFVVAAEALRSRQTNFDYGILLTTDEESNPLNHNGTRELVNQGLDPKMVVMPDGGYFDWRLEGGAKGAMHVTFEATRGISGHGSRPQAEDTAIERVAMAIAELRDEFRTQTLHEDTCNFGFLTGGETHNQIPPAASFGVDFRLTEPDSRAKRNMLVEKLCYKYQLGARIVGQGDIIRHDMDHPLMRGFADVMERVVGVKTDGDNLSCGGSDARFFNAKGKPCAVFYPYGGNHHGEREWVHPQSVELLPHLILNYLVEFAGR